MFKEYIILQKAHKTTSNMLASTQKKKEKKTKDVTHLHLSGCMEIGELVETGMVHKSLLDWGI